MEQDERLYEYTMASEVFRFEARSHAEALKMRGEAIEYFAEKAGILFSDDAVVGPTIVAPPPMSEYVPEKKRFPHSDR